MNRTIGLTSSVVTLAMSLGFLVTLANRIELMISICGLFMSIGFLVLICCFATIRKRGSDAFSLSSVCFAAAACAVFAIVYLPELTVERSGILNEFTYLISSLSYRYLGYAFYYVDMIALTLLSVSLFLLAHTIDSKGDEQRITLKITMLVQIVIGMFTVFASYFRLFSFEGNAAIARALMIAWSGIMAAICVASYLHFYNYDY